MMDYVHYPRYYTNKKAGSIGRSELNKKYKREYDYTELITEHSRRDIHNT
jgi:hypothetical protein